MKSSKLFSCLTPLLTLFLLLTTGVRTAEACDWCNNELFFELNTTRSGTLVADELLRAIHGQHDFEALAEKAQLEQRMARANGSAASADMSADSRNGASFMPAQTESPEPPVSTEPNTDADIEATTARMAAAARAPSNARAATPGRLQFGNGVDYDPDHPFIDIIERDANLETSPTSYIPQDSDVEPDARVSISLEEGDTYLGNGVMYGGFTTNGSIPGPTITVKQGDIVEFTVVNEGNIEHGASIHAAYTQTSKYLGKIPAGESRSMLFQVNTPGVFLYHCAPGGHAIPMHIIYGQYGTMIVEPNETFRLEEDLGREPDLEITIAQHELYANGKDAVTGQGNPMYTAFNGKLFRYVEEPIKARPGDYVRLHFLNIGPNLLSTFHIVGIIWDYAYWQGNPANMLVGGQSVTAGPSDSWTIEFRIPPDEGAYTMLSHAVGSTDRGAIGLIVAEEGVERSTGIDGRGPVYSEEELAELSERATRKISPFAPGSEDVDVPEKYGEETDEVIVRIIGNSFYPKIVDIKPGTKVTWVNEDVFTYMQGEFSGMHNAVAIGDGERFASRLLAHGESFSHVFEEIGETNYMCTPHPYMRGIVRVSEVESDGLFASAGFGIASFAIALIATLLAFMSMRRSRKEAIS